MRTTLTSRRVRVLAVAAVLAFGAQAMANPFTVATFADPAASGATPLFTVDMVSQRIFGGWAAPGLDLEVVLAGATYPDASFTLTDLVGDPGVSYVEPGYTGPTGGGFVRFFDDVGDPLLSIEFDEAFLTPGSMAADELVSLNIVDIRGDALPGGGLGLTDEAFGFAFANQELLPGDAGFTATASFTSSAVPEPSMVVLLGVGLMAVVGCRRTYFSGGCARSTGRR